MVQFASLVVIVVSTVACVSLNDFANPVTYLEPPIALLNETKEALGVDDDEGCTRNVGGVMTVPCACGWVCDGLFWVPVVEFVIAFLGMFLVMICDDDLDSGDFGSIICFMMVMIVACSWPLYAGGLLSSWGVAYLLAPFCAGAGASGMFVAPIVFLLESFGDDGIWDALAVCAAFVGFVAYLSATICECHKQSTAVYFQELLSWKQTIVDRETLFVVLTDCMCLQTPEISLTVMSKA